MAEPINPETPVPLPPPLPRRRVPANGVDVAVVEQGDGEPLLLLHGFPDCADLWAEQIPPLVAAGYRVIAPDLRGYGATAAPEGVEAYKMEALAGDVLALLDALEVEGPIKMAAHDWGAAIGWVLCQSHPERFGRYAAMSLGHLAAFRDAGLQQAVMSWYALMFQMPVIAEASLSFGDFQVLRQMAPNAETGARWARDLRRPGRLTAALNWYRANWQPLQGREFPPVEQDVMGLYGGGDVALAEQQIKTSGRFVRGEWRYERLPGAGHWLMLEQPERVSALLVEWFGPARA